MARIAEDLFGEKSIKVHGDSYLNGIANRIFQLYQHNPDLISGESMGQINRKIHLAMLGLCLISLILGVLLRQLPLLPQKSVSILSQSIRWYNPLKRQIRGTINLCESPYYLKYWELPEESLWL
jgi:hypothetical protein